MGRFDVPEKLHPSILGLLLNSDPQVRVGGDFESFAVQMSELPLVEEVSPHAHVEPVNCAG